MSGIGADRKLLRKEGGPDRGRVTFVELFFDLVFVFAITQLSHSLLANLTLMGAIETAILFMAVWWVWIFTSWVTNWLDPERIPVRFLLLVLMAAGLIMSASIPDAFAALGLAYAGAHVFIQVGRTLFMLCALREGEPVLRRNFERILIWLAGAGVLWIAGALAEGEWRLILWLAALAFEYAGPSLGFQVPGRGRSTTDEWRIEGGHMAERCALFIIIALGESILVTGATFAELAWTGATLAAFAAALIGSAAMWWIYFDTGHGRGSHVISHTSDPGRMARLAYTYLHLPIVAGIVVCAVADELLLAHADGHTEVAAVAVMAGGPALYLVGAGLFKMSFARRFPLSHLIGLGLLAMLIPVGFVSPPLLLGAATAGALVVVAAWETVSLRHLRRTLHPP